MDGVQPAMAAVFFPFHARQRRPARMRLDGPSLRIHDEGKALRGVDELQHPVTEDFAVEEHRAGECRHCDLYRTGQRENGQANIGACRSHAHGHPGNDRAADPCRDAVGPAGEQRTEKYGRKENRAGKTDRVDAEFDPEKGNGREHHRGQRDVGRDSNSKKGLRPSARSKQNAPERFLPFAKTRSEAQQPSPRLRRHRSTP